MRATKKSLRERPNYRGFKHSQLKRNTLAGKPYYVGVLEHL